MGYTNYWYYQPTGTTKEEQSFARASQRIQAYKNFLEGSGVIISGPLGEEEAIITPQEVRFNGHKATGNSHETFSVELGKQDHDEGFNFCKTARKPYDTLVCLALIAFRDELGEEIFHYASDGDDSDWSKAYEIYEIFHDLPAPRLAQESAETIKPTTKVA